MSYAIRGKKCTKYLPVGYVSQPEGMDHVMSLQVETLITAESEQEHLHVLDEVLKRIYSVEFVHIWRNVRLLRHQ